MKPRGVQPRPYDTPILPKQLLDLSIRNFSWQQVWGESRVAALSRLPVLLRSMSWTVLKVMIILMFMRVSVLKNMPIMIRLPRLSADAVQ